MSITHYSLTPSSQQPTTITCSSNSTASSCSLKQSNLGAKSSSTSLSVNLVEKKRKVRSQGKELPQHEFIFHLKMEPTKKKRKRSNPTAVDHNHVSSGRSEKSNCGSTSSSITTTTTTCTNILNETRVTTTTTTTRKILPPPCNLENSSILKSDKSSSFKMYNLPPKKAYSIAYNNFNSKSDSTTMLNSITKTTQFHLPPTTTKSCLPLPTKDSHIKNMLMPKLTYETDQQDEWHDVPLFTIPHFTIPSSSYCQLKI